MHKIMRLLLIASFGFVCKALSAPIVSENWDKEFYKQFPHKIFLLSYPRSGNTWMRYCIEHITHRATFDCAERRKMMRVPLSFSTGNYLDGSKAPVIKVHIKTELSGMEYSPLNDKLIFIIRNPKVVFINQFNRVPGQPEFDKNMAKAYFGIKSYFQAIAVYDEWQEENRLLVYYEDMLAHPYETLEKVVNFLQGEKNELDNFFKEFDFHRTQSKLIYNTVGLKIKDNTLEKLTTTISQNELLQFDFLAEQRYEHIWNRYLKERYAE